MKPAPFEYHAPTTLGDAVSLLATLPDAKLLAGGQSLMPMMNFRFLVPAHLIDMNNIGALSGIEVRDGRLRIGSMTRQRDIELSPIVARHAPLLPEAYRLVSHKQIRNRGTYGGSLCQLDPSSEQPCFTAVQDGILTIVRHADNKIHSREVPISKWAQMYMTPALEEGELLESVSLAIWPEGHGYAFTEYARRHGDYAIVGVAALCAVDASTRISRVAVAVCGIAPGPIRLLDAEAGLIGRPMDEDAIRLASAAARELEAMSDPHISSDYRQHLAGILTERALRTAFARVHRSDERK